MVPPPSGDQVRKIRKNKRHIVALTCSLTKKYRDYYLSPNIYFVRIVTCTRKFYFIHCGLQHEFEQF